MWAGDCESGGGGGGEERRGEVRQGACVRLNAPNTTRTRRALTQTSQMTSRSIVRVTFDIAFTQAPHDDSVDDSNGAALLVPFERIIPSPSIDRTATLLVVFARNSSGLD